MKGGERDELFDDAVRVILESQCCSVSLLQRRLTIGYSRASRLVDQMADAGLVPLTSSSSVSSRNRSTSRDRKEGFAKNNDTQETAKDSAA